MKINLIQCIKINYRSQTRKFEKQPPKLIVITRAMHFQLHF